MKFLSLTAGFVLPAVLASAAQAQLVNHKDLSLATALAIATTASETCKTQGNRVTVAVIGRTGELIVQLRGDDASPHTIENSFRKAYTARTFSTASGEFGQRQKENAPGFALWLSNISATPGGLPIKVGDDVIGAAGVSGAPGGEKDEACVKAALDKVADQLK